MQFDGKTYTHDRDGKRLGEQYVRVFNLMRDGKFRTLSDIRKETGDPESSVSARLRDMRKERFGAFNVERKYIDNGLYEYRLDIGNDGWIKNEGNSVCPVPPETQVLVKFRDGMFDDLGPTSASTWHWGTNSNHGAQIVAYKVVTVQ